MLTTILPLLALMFVSGQSSGDSFPCSTPGFVRSEDRQWCFHLSSQDQDFASSSIYCRTYGAILVTIENADKQEQLQQFLNNTVGPEPGVAFIGATNILADRIWTWYQSSEMTHTNWAENQPKNKTRYACAAMNLGRSGYKWETINCYRKDRYICQKPYTDAESIV